MTTQSHRRLLGAVLILVAAGCGKSDKFGRVSAEGLVTVDGQPVPYAQVFIESPPDNKNQSAKSTIRVVNGTFDVRSSHGPAEGENAVSIALYTAAPVRSGNGEDEDVEGDLVGTWTGTVNVESGKAIEFALNSSELKK